LKVIQDDFFTNNLKGILRFIAKDSKQKAQSFNTALLKKLKTLPNHPYKFRQSFYYESIQVRDFIFKGYTVPYLVNESKQVIVLLDIFKWSER